MTSIIKSASTWENDIQFGTYFKYVHTINKQNLNHMSETNSRLCMLVPISFIVYANFSIFWAGIVYHESLSFLEKGIQTSTFCMLANQDGGSKCIHV